MKKATAYAAVFLSAWLCLAPVCALAAEDTTVSDETAQTGEAAAQNDAAEPAETDLSAPRLMVTDYKTDSNSITPGQETTLTVTLQNYSRKKAVENIRLAFTEETGDLRPNGVGTKYVEKISPGRTYTWELGLTAAQTATVGEHATVITMDYEDEAATPYTASDTLRLTVRQSVSLDYEGARLPNSVVQDDTVTMSIQLMNTGKSLLRNCRVQFDIAGLDAGGSVFVGEIAAGESGEAAANLRVDSDALGETSGEMTILYEDEYGQSYTQTADLTTTIEKKVVKEAESETQEDKEKYPLWWVFLLVGLVCGGAAGSGVVLGVKAHKQRLEDEKRL